MKLSIEGKTPQITDFSLQADVVSVNPSDTSAGVGGLSAVTPLHSSGLQDLWNFLYGSTVDLEFNGAESTASVLEVELSDLDNLSITAESPLRPLQATALVRAYTGPLRLSLSHIVNSVKSIPVYFDPSVPSTQVVVPAHYGNVWVFLRDFMTVHRIELVLRPDGAILFRKMGASPAVFDDSNSVTGKSIRVSGENTAEYVEIEYFDNVYITNGTVYPVEGDDPSVISVEAGETAVIELTTLTGMNSVNQPTPMDWIDNGFTGSGYTIAGNDGLPVKASNWTASGGSVRAEIKEDDPYTIILTVTAPTEGVLGTVDERNTVAPYHLAMTDGELYPRLFITGTGVRTNPRSIEVYTGADDELVEPGVGYTLSNPCVGTLSQAYDVGIRLAQAYCGANTQVSRTSPSFDDFTSAPGGKYETKDSNYRVESVSYEPTGASFTAHDFTTFDDFNSTWSTRPHTFNDFNAHWTAQPKSRFRDFSIAPLR